MYNNTVVSYMRTIPESELPCEVLAAWIYTFVAVTQMNVGLEEQ